MANIMLELRQVRLSLFYFLKDLLDTNGYGSSGFNNNELVTLMLSYPTDAEINKIVISDKATGGSEEIVLPVIAIDFIDQFDIPLELGSAGITERLMSVSLFGDEESETDDLAQQLYEWLKLETIPLNNYNSGFPPDVVPPKVGTVHVEGLRLIKMRSEGPNVANNFERDIQFRAIVNNTQTSQVVFT